MLAAPNYTVHRNDFLEKYLYSFRNRLSEMKLKGIIGYSHKSGFYTLTTPLRAIEFIYGTREENAHEAGEKIEKRAAVTIKEGGKAYNLSNLKQTSLFV